MNMTFQRALDAELAAFDEIVAEIRKMLADPAHLNSSSKEFVAAKTMLGVCTEQAFHLKNAHWSAQQTIDRMCKVGEARLKAANRRLGGL